MSCMAPPTNVQIANNVQWAAILAALSVSSCQFLKWRTVECLAFLINLAIYKRWLEQAHYCKVFSKLLLISCLDPKCPPLPSGPIRFFSPFITTTQSQCHGTETPSALSSTLEGGPYHPEVHLIEEAQTCQILTFPVALPIINLPFITPLSTLSIPYEDPNSLGPVTCICHSSPCPCNVIFKVPINLGLPWITKVSIQFAQYWATNTSYKPWGHKADLWEFLINLSVAGMETAWAPPAERELIEHKERVTAVAAVTARFAHALISYLYCSPAHLRALSRAIIPLLGNSGLNQTNLLSIRLNCSCLPSKRLNCSRLVSGLEC